MKEFNAEEARFETVTAIGAFRQAEAYTGYPAYIGLDVHKETIAVAVARAGRQAGRNRSLEVKLPTSRRQ